MKLKLLFITCIVINGCASKNEKSPKTDIDMVKLHHEAGNPDRVKYYMNKRIKKVNDDLTKDREIYDLIDDIFFN